MFHEGGTVGKNVSWSGTPESLQKWKEGRTGLPLVDANMRELAATGEAAGIREGMRSATQHMGPA